MELLEREEHIAALDGWLREAACGQGRFVLVAGEAGVGKTALIDTFCRTLSGRAVVRRGSCDALSTPRPLGPLLDIAAEVGGELNRLINGEGSRDQVFRAVLTALNSCMTAAVVVIEDAHWADDATLDLLRFIVRRLDTTRAMVVVTYRDDELGPYHPLRMLVGDLATARSLRRLCLAPLSQDAIREFAAESKIDPIPLYRLTNGNPFFASEVLAGNTIGGIPAAVSDAVLARAARLPRDGRDVLDAASVIGDPITIDLLLDVSGATAGDVESCIAGGMFVAHDEGTLAFRHELARVAVYDAIPPLRRQALHARTLAVLEAAEVADPDFARLAHHAEASANCEAVLRFAPLAARRAARLSAHREAAAQYARALRFAKSLEPEERAELLEASAYEHYLIDRLSESIVLQQEATRIWRERDNRLREGNALRWESRYSWFAGRNDDALAAAHEALDLLEALPPGRELAMALSNRAQLHMLAYENEDAIALAERAIALAESLGETEVLMHALTNSGTARLALGDERGRAELERSIELARTAGLDEHLIRATSNLGNFAVRFRDLTRAEGYVRTGLAFTTDRNLENFRLYVVANRASLSLRRGDWSAAATDAGDALAHPKTSAITRIHASVVRGLVDIRRGHPGGDERFTEALTLAETTHEFQRLHPVRIARAEAAWLSGDRARAIAELHAILDLTLRRGSPWDLGDVLFWLQRCDAFNASDHSTYLDGLPEPYRLGLTGDWAAAAAAWEAIGCPYERALTLLDGDEPAAREALTIFERLGARPAAVIAGRRLRSLGARGIPRGPRPATRSNPANLTCRELEVLSLIAAGRRNAEIAERLFLSPKTVDHHVGRVLAKLDIRSRAGAADAAMRRGISLVRDPDGDAIPRR